jgi:PAS domain S-box-containing protein
MINPESTRAGARDDGTPVSLPHLGAAHTPRERAGVGPAPPPRPLPDRRAWLAAAGLLLLFLCHPRLWHATASELWFPPAGLALALVAWLGLWAAGLAAAATLLAGLLTLPAGGSPLYPLVEALVLAAEVGGGWWCYHDQARGARKLDDPRSAVLFLIFVPGLAAGLSGLALALGRLALGEPRLDLFSQAASSWIAHALGLLALAPPLLALATPWLRRHGLTAAAPGKRPRALGRWPWTRGETVELAGLVSAAGVVGVALAMTYARLQAVNWPLWGLLLLLVVWTSLRYGLPGGSLASGVAAVAGLSASAVLLTAPSQAAALEGHLLAQCTVALLVGASVGWIRASESRYRQFVGHMPVVLYSARLSGPPVPRGSPAAEITLVSGACEQILGAAADELQGDYLAWLDHVHPGDRELLSAALAQLCLQKQPVTCEYRLAPRKAEGEKRKAEEKAADHAGERGALSSAFRFSPSAFPAPLGQERWLRDTLAPRYGADGALEGWEGVVEDITEQRGLASDLRRTTGMLQALVTHLPTGVFFVHGPLGQPLFVNARARQLLGRREDMAAGLEHLAQVYRLHRADGTPYAWEDLPVSQALRLGTAGMRDDIVVHRPDGRRTPLVTWAAPVNLGGQDHAAAVWVLEDLTALRQAEAAHRAAEARLRAIIETMAEGLVVQDRTGRVVQWNPAACAILGVAPEDMARRSSLAPDVGPLCADGSPLPADEHPDRISLRTGRPVRDVVVGLPAAAADAPVRWLLVNTMPLPAAREGDRGGQIVTTFADITAQRQAAEVHRLSEEKYRELVESLPLLVIRVQPGRRVTYLNPAAGAAVGHLAAELAAGVWEGMVALEDLALLQELLDQAGAGRSARGEFRFRARDLDERVGYALAQPAAQGGGGEATLLVVDMTSQRRLERELQRVQRLDLVGRLAGGVIHDVNNMLTVILAMTELVQSALEPEHVARPDLQRIRQAADQAKQLMGQLLAFSKDRRVPARRVDLNALVERNLELVRGAAPRNVEVHTELAPAGAWALAEETQLQQVLMNLCLNARDAMPAGGRLTVATAADGDGPQVRLSVRDTGQGMSAEVRARIFELFFTTKERGSGLGLAVVKQIVESFGGRIEVSSAPGAGACFDVWLPGAPAP